MNRLRTLWGEPVAIWAVIQAASATAVGFGWLSGIGISGQHGLAILVLVENGLAAVHVAVVTRHTLLAPVIELTKALAVLGAVYGLHISNEQTGLVVTLITVAFAAFHRTQTSPVPVPVARAAPPEHVAA